MTDSSSGGFKWKLTRDIGFDVWSIQFQAHLLTKSLLRWLTDTPDPSKPTEVEGDLSCKAQIVLAMKDPSLIRLSMTSSSAKTYWDALVNDFEGRIRLRKHEIVNEERSFAQKKSESYVDYCDRAAELEAKMVVAGIDTGCLVDHVILGLSEPFQRNNRDSLTKVAHESTTAKALQEVLTFIRLYSRLSPKPGAPDAVALAAASADIRKGRKFIGNCHYCDIKGHKSFRCKKRLQDEKNGCLKQGWEAGGRSSKPAAALVCEGSVIVDTALTVLHTRDDAGVMLYDSCCTHHVVTEKQFLYDFGPSAVKFMRMGGNEAHPVEGQGTAILLGGPSGKVVLQTVLYVPTMIHNLLSRGQALARGAKETADSKGFTLTLNNRQLLSGDTNGMSKLRQRLQRFAASSTEHASAVHGAESNDDSTHGRACVASGDISLRLAHERLGHMNLAQVKRVATSDAVTGLRITNGAGGVTSCIICTQAKQTSASFPPSQSRAREPLQIVHMDTVGPMQQVGFDGSQYAVPVHDDFSSYTTILCVKSKDQIAEAVIDLLVFWQRQTGCKVLCIRSDNGTEFQGELTVWCQQHGVLRQYSAVYTPTQNGRAERKNRTIVEGSRAQLLQRDTPVRFWPFAMQATAYILNRVPAAGQIHAPLTLMFPGQVPNLSSLRVFGCSASLFLPKKQRDGKFAPVSVSGVFVGYSPHTKGWRVAVGNKVHDSPNVVFHEEMNGDCSVAPRLPHVDEDSDCESDEAVATGGIMHASVHPPVAGDALAPVAPLVTAEHAGNPDGDDHVATGDHMHAEVHPPVVAGAGTHPPVAPAFDAFDAGDTDLDESVVGEVHAVPQAPEALRRSGRVTYKPNRYEPGNALLALGADEFPVPDHDGHAYAASVGDVPKSYADIANFGDLAELWYESYKREKDNMYHMNVLRDITAANVPTDEHVIGSTIDFRVKHDPSGAVADRKTRICARGDQQQAGFDYQEVFTPMAAVDSTRMLFAAAAHADMHVHQVDVKAAYLNAPLKKPVHMRPPKGDPALQGVVWLVEKALYGLPESGLLWHEMLTSTLEGHGFKPCLTDPCLFVKRDDSKCTYVLVYVDDMLVAGELSDVIRVKQQLAQSFTIKDLGVAYHFLGFLVHRDMYGIRLTQEQYTKVVLQRFGFENAHPKRTPFNEGTAKECSVRCQCSSAEKNRQNFKVAKNECTCAPYDEPGIDMRAFVGAAMFLATRSRPDISFSVGVLSRFVDNPKSFHAPLVKHLLRYLLGTIDWGLFYPSGRFHQESSSTHPVHMQLFTDSDHCGEEKMRSTSGWAVMMYGCLVAWGSKLQATAVESTCAAEFVAACMGENATMKLKDLLFEMTGEAVTAELLVDNQSAVGKLNRPAGGNMWLALKWRVLHQRHMHKVIAIRYVPTAEQLGDIFTKSLTPVMHEKAVVLLGMYCAETKATEYDGAAEKAVLLEKGVTVPLPRHTCIYKGARECVVCKQFYADFH
jgi:transposase InsO family protein